MLHEQRPVVGISRNSLRRLRGIYVYETQQPGLIMMQIYEMLHGIKYHQSLENQVFLLHYKLYSTEFL